MAPSLKFCNLLHTGKKIYRNQFYWFYAYKPGKCQQSVYISSPNWLHVILSACKKIRFWQNFLFFEFFFFEIFSDFWVGLSIFHEFSHEPKHNVFETVYVSVYGKLGSLKPWVYDIVYERSCFRLKLHKIFKLLDILLFSDIWVKNLIWIWLINKYDVLKKCELKIFSKK